jgi:hypothetical protein
VALESIVVNGKKRKECKEGKWGKELKYKSKCKKYKGNETRKKEHEQVKEEKKEKRP